MTEYQFGFLVGGMTFTVIGVGLYLFGKWIQRLIE